MLNTVVMVLSKGVSLPVFFDVKDSVIVGADDMPREITVVILLVKPFVSFEFVEVIVSLVALVKVVVSSVLEDCSAVVENICLVEEAVVDKVMEMVVEVVDDDVVEAIVDGDVAGEDVDNVVEISEVIKVDEVDPVVCSYK